MVGSANHASDNVEYAQLGIFAHFGGKGVPRIIADPVRDRRAQRLRRLRCNQDLFLALLQHSQDRVDERPDFAIKPRFITCTSRNVRRQNDILQLMKRMIVR